MYNPILSIGGEDLESLSAVKLLDLIGLLSLRGLTPMLGPDASVHSTLVYEYHLVRTEGRYFMHIFISQIWIALSRDVWCGFNRKVAHDVFSSRPNNEDD